MGRSLANVSLSLGIVIFITTTGEGRILGYGIAALGGGAVAILFLRKDKLIGLEYSRKYIKEAVAFGAPLIPHVAGMFLIFAIDRVIINAKLGLATAGIYMVAVQCSMGVGVILDSINKAYVPWLFRILKEDTESEKLRVVRMTYAFFLFMAAMAALGFWVGPFVVTMIAGSGYEAAGRVIGWLVLGQCLRGMYMAVTNYNFYAKRTGVISGITIISGICNVALLFVFIDLYGMVGAGISLCCAMLLQFLATWKSASTLQPMPWVRALKA